MRIPMKGGSTMELSEAQIRDYALDDAIYQQGRCV